MIDVRPDPAHPRGGYAILSFDGASVADESVSLEVFDLYKELFLGKAGWQPERHSFGPYPVDRSGGQAKVVVGPEIVDRIEEFATLRLTLGALTDDIGWPDDVVHSPKAATSDAAIKFGGGPATPTAAAPIKMKSPDPDPVPGDPEPTDLEGAEDTTPKPKPIESGPVQIDDDEKKTGSKLPLLLGGAAVLAALVLAALFLMPEDEPAIVEPDPVPAPPAEPEPLPPVVSVEPDPCSDAELANVAAQGFAALGEVLRGCGGSVTADVALGLVQAAVDDGDPDALAFFGTLYDTSQSDPVIKEQIGLRLGDNPALAAEYYARAGAAGAAGADALLLGVCRTLLLRTDTLSIGAREDFCPN